MSNHLWQSTWFAVAAGLIAWVLRRNRASVRFWVWLSASVKFLVPFALFMSLGGLFPKAQRAPIAPPAFSAAIVEFAQPFAEPVPAAPIAHNWRPNLFLAVWGCGFLAVAVIRVRGWLGLRRAMRFTPELIEPGVIGLWRPKLVLPAGIESRLTPAQIDAIVAHEMCHVRRRDNLLAVAHMTVEAIFWFHPLVWWIGARLIEERERACDEEVLRSGSAPDVYAEAILNVCKFYAESRMPCVAGVTGADLKKRIEAVMNGRIGRELNFARKAILASAGVALVALPVVIGLWKTPPLRAQSTPKFEVASVKPCNAGEGGGRGGAGGGKGAEFSPDRLDLDCNTVESMIRTAYINFANGRRNSGGRSISVTGGPSWIGSERYQVEARAEAEQTREMLQGPMLQTLLEERFHLQIHRETKEVPAYVATVAKGGLKLSPAKEPCEPDIAKLVAARESGRKVAPCGVFFGRIKDRPGLVSINLHGVSVTAFFNQLGDALSRPVVDKTGITGAFDVRAEFLPDELTPRLLGNKFFALPEGVAPEPGPSIVDALREQLGLKLDPGKGPAEYLVIDHIERPSAN